MSRKLGMMAALPLALVACGPSYKDCVIVEKFGTNKLYTVYDKKGKAVAEYIDKFGNGSVDWFKDYTSDFPRTTKIGDTKNDHEQSVNEPLYPGERFLYRSDSEAHTIQTRFNAFALAGKECHDKEGVE